MAQEANGAEKLFASLGDSWTENQGKTNTHTQITFICRVISQSYFNDLRKDN